MRGELCLYNGCRIQMLRAMKHTSATVFVDDYLGGRVPDVCAVSGRPTTDRLVMSTEIDGPSPGWLFLLLFPFLGRLMTDTDTAASSVS